MFLGCFLQCITVRQIETFGLNDFGDLLVIHVRKTGGCLICLNLELPSTEWIGTVPWEGTALGTTIALRSVTLCYARLR